jgi:hypothetical protein
MDKYTYEHRMEKQRRKDVAYTVKFLVYLTLFLCIMAFFVN